MVMGIYGPVSDYLPTLMTELSDDKTAFGPVFHRLGFAEAIERALLTDYQVVVVGVDDALADGSWFGPDKSGADSFSRWGSGRNDLVEPDHRAGEGGAAGEDGVGGFLGAKVSQCAGGGADD
jgi:hypothetical protein